MKMVKSLLLGSAAGLAAVSGTQAADLPVKAKPVEYVKICSLYGEGFYYIPGSQICLKIGGYVRADYGWNVTGARTPHYTRRAWRARSLGEPVLDAASRALQLRQPHADRLWHAAHLRGGPRRQQNQGTVTVNPTRAFIQWAGFTFGHTKSFTDTPGTPGDDTFKSLFQTQNQSDTGANGTNQIAYTWELGNGMTLNVGADERRTKGIGQPVEQRGHGRLQPGHSVRPIPASDPVGELRGQPGLGPVWCVGDLQQGQRDLLHRQGCTQLPAGHDRHPVRLSG